METCIRVIECGGQGPRRVDVANGKVVACDSSAWGESVSMLKKFAHFDLRPKTKAVIYSVAGMVEDHSRVIACPNIHMLDGIRLGKKIGERDIPAFVCNDMEASVTGMAEFFPELFYFMGITRSTGIGVRIWKNGEILSDSEAAHICVDNSPYAPVCGCGKRGCAESIIGGNAITKFVLGEMGLRGEKIPAKIHPCEWLDISYAAKADWAVRRYQDVIVPAMAAFLSTLQTILHLPAIVWKGTLGLRSFKDIPELEGLIREEMKKRIINPSWVDDLKFHFLCCPKDHEAYIGAAKIARKLLSE